MAISFFGEFWHRNPWQFLVFKESVTKFHGKSLKKGNQSLRPARYDWVQAMRPLGREKMDLKFQNKKRKAEKPMTASFSANNINEFSNM